MIDNSLFRALVRLAAIQREGVDRLALTEAAEAAQALSEKPKEQLAQVCRHMGIAPPGWIHTPDGSHLPAIIHDGAREWGVLVGRDPQQRWVVQFWQGNSNAGGKSFTKNLG